MADNITHVGLLIKAEPLIEEESHSVPIVKDLHYRQYIALPAEERLRLAKAVSPMNATMSVDSNSDLKPMIKFIP